MSDTVFKNTLIIPFTYIVTQAITTGQAVQTQLTMASDSSFELLEFVASSTLDGDADVIPNQFSVQVTDQSTGRQLSNARVPQRMYVASTYTAGSVEKYPIRFPAQCVLLFDFLDISGSGDSQTVTFGLKGYKLIQQ